MCRNCGRDGRYSDCDPHHIIYRSETLTLADDPNNGILLCRVCHNLVHAHKLSMLNILDKLKSRADFRWEAAYNMLKEKENVD
jgi:5-methylcytosine-specific restriction endonuclease McrA